MFWRLVGKEELHVPHLQAWAGRCSHPSISAMPPLMLFLATDAFVQGREHILLISVIHNFLCKEFPSSKQNIPPPSPKFPSSQCYSAD